MQLLEARRFAFLLADTVEAALLLDEATWALERDDDARKAVVARRFARERLAALPARGILDSDRTALDHFDTVVRYGAARPGRRVRSAPPRSGGSRPSWSTRSTRGSGRRSTAT